MSRRSLSTPGVVQRPSGDEAEPAGRASSGVAEIAVLVGAYRCGEGSSPTHLTAKIGSYFRKGHKVIRAWLRALRRRGQRHRLTWERFGPIVNRVLPHPAILHPHPNERFYAKHPK